MNSETHSGQASADEADSTDDRQSGMQTGHYSGSWGELRSREGQLFSLADVVRIVKAAKSVPHVEAVRTVTERLRDNDFSRCYITRPADWATPVRRPAVWPVAVQAAQTKAPSAHRSSVQPQSPMRWTRFGCFELVGMRQCDLREVLNAYLRCLQSVLNQGHGFVDDDLYVVIDGGQLAIHGDDVLKLFADDWAAVFPEPETSPAPAILGALQADAVAASPAVADDPQPEEDRRFKAVRRFHELADQKGAAPKVAREFDVDVRTVRKWQIWVEDQQANQRRQAADMRQVANLCAGQGNR